MDEDRYELGRMGMSALVRFVGAIRTLRVRFSAAMNPRVRLGQACQFGRDVELRATDGGTIKVGARCSIGHSVQIVAAGGAVTIGDDVFIGAGTVIVAVESVSIGADTLVAEYVVVRDQDHTIRSRPIRNAVLRSSPLAIGRDVWIGCKATVLRGATIGDGCVIGAHALVRTVIAAGSLAVGCPARVVRKVDAENC